MKGEVDDDDEEEEEYEAFKLMESPMRDVDDVLDDKAEEGSTQMTRMSCSLFPLVGGFVEAKMKSMDGGVCIPKLQFAESPTRLCVLSTSSLMLSLMRSTKLGIEELLLVLVELLLVLLEIRGIVYVDVQHALGEEVSKLIVVMRSVKIRWSV
jgi:hypothetical protein